MQVKVKEGIYMEVDSDDWLRFCLTVGRSIYINTKGYAVFKYKNKAITFHRWLLNFPELEVDHINSNKLDNRKVNLRLVTSSQNKRNCNDKLQLNNTSGFRGVRFEEDRQLWLAYIYIKRNRIRLGSFIRQEDAIVARKEAEKNYGFM